MKTFKQRMEDLDQEMAAIEKAAEQVRRLRCTPPVDDDFPQVKHEYDQAAQDLMTALKRNGRI